jgi:hypothetical protein
MGVRGRRPTATVIRLITGNPGKRPLPVGEPMPEGKPVMPKWLKGRAAELWDEVLTFGFWLTVADSYKLAAWCDRQADFEKPAHRKEWTAADRREHRASGSEIGLDNAARSRMGAKNPDGEKKDPASKYLG